MFQVGIREVLASNIGRDTKFPDTVFVFLSSCNEIPGQYLGEAQTISFYIISSSLFSTHLTVIGAATS
jgi:hypothetical protein